MTLKNLKGNGVYVGVTRAGASPTHNLSTGVSITLSVAAKRRVMGSDKAMRFNIKRGKGRSVELRADPDGRSKMSNYLTEGAGNCGKIYTNTTVVGIKSEKQPSTEVSYDAEYGYLVFELPEHFEDAMPDESASVVVAAVEQDTDAVEIEEKPSRFAKIRRAVEALNTLAEREGLSLRVNDNRIELVIA